MLIILGEEKSSRGAARLEGELPRGMWVRARRYKNIPCPVDRLLPAKPFAAWADRCL
jgi:hypothetical protein